MVSSRKCRSEVLQAGWLIVFSESSQNSLFYKFSYSGQCISGKSVESASIIGGRTGVMPVQSGIRFEINAVIFDDNEWAKLF